MLVRVRVRVRVRARVGVRARVKLRVKFRVRPQRGGRLAQRAAHAHEPEPRARRLGWG